jgi:TonB family protein
MSGLMQPDLNHGPLARNDAGQRPLSLGVAWTSPWREFLSSVRAAYFGPRPFKDGPVSGGPYLRVHWIQGTLPLRAFLASSVWHAATILILLLPIWSFLSRKQYVLAPEHIELTWAPTDGDLPPIFLPAAGPKRRSPANQPHNIEDPPAQSGADVYHPRQTILSMPVRLTHPRQTLIQPAALPEPPKVDPPLPNIVQWSSGASLPMPVYSHSTSAPRIQRRALNDVAAPEVADLRENPGPLNIVLMQHAKPEVQMPVLPMSTAISQRHNTKNDSGGPAPEIGPSASAGDPSLGRLLALSATPALPAPVVEVPQGNLAARIAISPEGTRPGVPSGAEKVSAKGNGSSQGSEISTGLAGALPAAVIVSGGNSHSGSAVDTIAGSHSNGKLILKPMTSLPDRPDPMVPSHRGPSVAGLIDPSLPPEKILSGKEVYTMHIDLPNLTSASGSWILNFAELDENRAILYKLKGKLAAPVPIRKVDPKYPPLIIREHVDGEVILYAIIRKDGSVDSIQLVRGIDSRLDKYAVEALAQWQFRPATRDGVPTDIEAVVHIPFRFRKPDF